MNSKTKQKKKSDNQKLEQVGFQEGDVRKVCFKERSNIYKGKGPKKDRRTPPKIILKMGLRDKRQGKKWNFERKDKRKTRKTQNRKNRRILQTGLLGEQKRKTSLKVQENSLFLGPFSPKRPKKIKQKREQNTFWHVGKQPPIFGKFQFFSSLRSFSSAKLCLLKTL